MLTLPNKFATLGCTHLLQAAGHDVLTVNEANLEAADYTIENQFVILNQWNY